MAREAVNMKCSIALLAKVFDFLNQLNEDQINDLLEDKASLSLDVLIDGRVDAIISEKLNAKLEETLGALINKSLGTGNRAGSIGKGKKKKDKSDVVKPSNRKPNATSGKTDALEPIASAVRSLSSKESIAEYFEKNPLKVSAMKSLANRHFGISDTRKMNTESLIDRIIGVVTEED